MDYKRLRQYIPVVIFAVCISLFNNLFVYVDAANSETAGLKGLTISPIKSQFEISPGTSRTGVLSVTNSTNELMEINFSAEEFRVTNQNYDYAFTSESDVAKWIKFDNSEITLSSGQSSEVGYLVGVPLSAEPGGRYISIFASTESNSLSGIKSKQRIGSLLYVTVLGDVSRLGNLISLSSPWLVFEGGEWSASLQNTGTTHYVSRYNVSIVNLISGSVVSNSTGDAMILPGTVRLVTDVLPSLNWPGLYKVIYEIGLGDTPATYETRYVLYLPPVATVSAVVVITILSVTILRRKKSKKI